MADDYKNLINFERLQQYDRKFQNYATKSELQTVDSKATTASTSAAAAVAAAQANATAIEAMSGDIYDMDQEIQNFVDTADTLSRTVVSISNAQEALETTLTTNYENKTVAETKYVQQTSTYHTIDSLVNMVSATYETKGDATTKYTEVSQEANKILWLISNGSTQQSLTMTNALLEAIVNQFVVKDPAGTATIISGGKIHTGSLTADMLFVEDLSAVKGNLDKARIGGLVIENGSIHSLNKTAINDPDAGLFFDSMGQMNTGDEYNFIASWYEADYELTEDVAIDSDKTYYTRSGTSPNYTYTAVAEPAVADIDTYYEDVGSWKVAIRADQITFGSGDSVATLIQNAANAASAAQESADATLIYDHDYTMANGVATFTAYLYRGGVDVKTEFDTDQFTWYLKTEDGETYLGSGYTCTVNTNTCGYGAEVVGKFTITDDSESLTRGG